MSGPKDDVLTLWQRQYLTRRSTALVRRGLAEAEGLKGLDKMQPPSSRSGLQEPNPWTKVRESAEALVRGDVTNSMGMDLVRIPEGKFMMGSDLREDEKPIHEVTIKKPFYIGQYPVIQSHWRQIMRNNPSTLVSDNSPVNCISWDDAQEFIRELNSRDDEFEYRLPSEAEWEYACRAGLTGDVTSEMYFMDIYGDAPRGQSIQPVGERRPNAFGLHGMLVGFKEWCEDRYHVNYIGAPSDGLPWGAIEGEENRVPQMNRVARGAFSASPSSYWRAAARSWAAPSSRGSVFALRLAAVKT